MNRAQEAMVGYVQRCAELGRGGRSGRGERQRLERLAAEEGGGGVEQNRDRNRESVS